MQKLVPQNIMQMKGTTMKNANLLILLGFIVGCLLTDYFNPAQTYYIKGSNELVQTLIARRDYNFDVCFEHPRLQIKNQNEYCAVYNELDVILRDLTKRGN